MNDKKTDGANAGTNEAKPKIRFEMDTAEGTAETARQFALRFGASQEEFYERYKARDMEWMAARGIDRNDMHKWAAAIEVCALLGQKI